jgi:hypothetical protein
MLILIAESASKVSENAIYLANPGSKVLRIGGGALAVVFTYWAFWSVTEAGASEESRAEASAEVLESALPVLPSGLYQQLIGELGKLSGQNDQPFIKPLAPENAITPEVQEYWDPYLNPFDLD